MNIIVPSTGCRFGFLATTVLLAAAAAQAQTAAKPAANFTNSVGVNAHIDFTTTAYGNLTNVSNAVSFLGVKHIRDCPGNTNDQTWWGQVKTATGAKFDAFIGEVNAAGYDTQMTRMSQLAGAGLLGYIEGGNEPDSAYAATQGDSMVLAAQKQQALFTLGQTLALPVIQTSFGQVADYGSQGNQAAYANFGNAHTYYGTGNPPTGGWIGTINTDALKTTPGKPVITTESGYYTTSSTTDKHNINESVQGRYTLDILFEMFKAGDSKVYLYELLDQQTGSTDTEKNFGLFHSDGSVKPAATAVHNLMTLMADTGTAPAASLTYSLTNMPAAAGNILFNKSNGTFWIAAWNPARLSGPTAPPTEITVPPVAVGLTLGQTAKTIAVFDPWIGTTAVQTVSNAATMTFNLPDHPVLIQVTPLTYNPVLTGPTSITYSGTEAFINNLQLSDPYAASHPGNLALNVTTAAGQVSMLNNGVPVTGSGTTAIHTSATFSVVNAELSTLTYTFPAGMTTGTVTVNVWDQGGISTTKNINLTLP